MTEIVEEAPPPDARRTAARMLPLVAVGGRWGKTTTARLLEAMLQRRRDRLALWTDQGIWVNGRRLSMEVFDPRDLRPRKGNASNQGRQEIAASMPGKVIRVLVTAGDSVEEGQGLVVVEAMKMQNEMKSPKSGRVAEVRTRADATVGAGEVLVVVE